MRKQRKPIKKAAQQVSAKKTSKKSKAQETKPRRSRSAAATESETPARNIAELQLR